MDKNLSAFLAIAKEGNLTAAADKIGLTQPTLTKRLSNLEHELGSILFDRHRRGMSLTPAGKAFYRRALKIEQELLQAKEELRGLENAGLDVIRIGAGPLFHQKYVGPVFSKLLLEFPALRLDLSVSNNEVNLPRLLRGDLDIVLGAIEPTGPDGAIKSIHLTSLEHGLVLAPDHKLGQLEFVYPEQLRDLIWAIYGDDEITEEPLNQYYLRNGLGSPHIAIHTASFATGLGLVRDSGFCMMAPVQIASVIEQSGLRVVRANPPLTNLTSGAYVRPSSLNFPAISRFLDLIAETFEAEAAHG
ncbi:LysR family transcriptional regulator [uncultured Cohaesibacter sp.]|uniref:LysR family transcriptional regulator n=1 Tax=uncultured Cohaesibacter sp. TaxID=1002546 RepID=UPI0029C75A4A|nr:LysR family transcriptional regulator [uncultured Cohaesibacter sp.]